MKVKMKIKNLTPHQINIYRAGLSGPELAISLPKPESDEIARVDVNMRAVNYLAEVNGTNVDPQDGLGGVAEYEPEYGEPSPIPPESNGTIYVVSMMYKMACNDRGDLRSPGTPLRDAKGVPIGCYGLVI